MLIDEAETKEVSAVCANSESGSLTACTEIGTDQHFSIPYKQKKASTGIVIVNWNSWPETLESLEAIFKMREFDGPVVVCDNASSDDSVENIKAWAAGMLCALPENTAPEIYSLVVPPVAKSFPYRCLSASQLEGIPAEDIAKSVRLWIVRCSDNRGFASGNNIGIRFLRRIRSIQWFWLLNTDTVPSSNAYRTLLQHLPVGEGPVIAGGTLLEYWHPAKVQACGAIFNPYLLSTRNNLRGISACELNKEEPLMPVSYPVGASIIVNRSFIDEVGLMCESYFLYYEEIDWVIRHSWPSKAFIITSSHVYHKGGKTTGGGDTFNDRTLVADYHFIRSRMMLAKKLGRLQSILVIMITMAALLKRVAKQRPGAFNNTLRALFDGLRTDNNQVRSNKGSSIARYSERLHVHK